jgi:hypothetical protein
VFQGPIEQIVEDVVGYAAAGAVEGMVTFPGVDDGPALIEKAAELMSALKSADLTVDAR